MCRLGLRWESLASMPIRSVSRCISCRSPIYDAVVAEVVGLHRPGTYWKRWYQDLSSAAGDATVKRLGELRDVAGQHHLSLLRVLDIILWRHGRQGSTFPKPWVNSSKTSEAVVTREV